MSISAQGVVERASAELSKRITGLGLRGSSKQQQQQQSQQQQQRDTAPPQPPRSPKASVMERVTNVFCGGGGGGGPLSGGGGVHGGSPQHQQHAPEKPSRLPSLCKAKVSSTSTESAAFAAVPAGTPGAARRRSRTGPQPPPRPTRGPAAAPRPCPCPGRLTLPAVPVAGTWEQLLLEERYGFAGRLLEYLSPGDKRVLAQVCPRWRDALYRSPRHWAGLLPVLRCAELRPGRCSQQERDRLYVSLVRRGFHAVCLLGATDEDALDLVTSFPAASKHIHSLSLRCSSVSDRGLETLLDHLQSLFELELAGCNEITEAGLWACLSPRLVSLTLTDCINVADEAVGAVAQLLPSLYEFSLQAYHVTDAALGFFSNKQAECLSILRLQSCWELTNHGVINIVHSLPNLTVLSLSGCSKVTDEGVEMIAENLHMLRCLDLSWCPRVTDAALECIACDLNQLEELTLDRCVHITDIGVGYISTMLSLSALFLRWCSQVRDFGLQHLCGMRNLQVLSLAGCPQLTSSGLSSLIQLRHLQELELTNCPGASQELFEYLREHLPRCLVIE